MLKHDHILTTSTNPLKKINIFLTQTFVADLIKYNFRFNRPFTTSLR